MVMSNMSMDGNGLSRLGGKEQLCNPRLPLSFGKEMEKGEAIMQQQGKES